MCLVWLSARQVMGIWLFQLWLLRDKGFVSIGVRVLVWMCCWVMRCSVSKVSSSALGVGSLKLGLILGCGVAHHHFSLHTWGLVTLTPPVWTGCPPSSVK